MPKGHAAGREAKKPKKKPVKQIDRSAPLIATSDVEVVKKRKKPREEEEDES
jgi:hypothetical protein